MMPLILMALIVALPVILGILFRVSSVYIFVSIAVGELLVKFLGVDAGLVASGFIKGQNGPTIAYVLMLIVPLVMTALFLKGSLPHSKLPLHIVPLIAVGLMFLVFMIPLLPSGVQQQVFTTKPGEIFKKTQDLVVAVTGVIILLTMWATSRHHQKHNKHHK